MDYQSFIFVVFGSKHNIFVLHSDIGYGRYMYNNTPPNTVNNIVFFSAGFSCIRGFTVNIVSH